MLWRRWSCRLLQVHREAAGDLQAIDTADPHIDSICFNREVFGRSERTLGLRQEIDVRACRRGRIVNAELTDRVDDRQRVQL